MNKERALSRLGTLAADPLAQAVFDGLTRESEYRPVLTPYKPPVLSPEEYERALVLAIEDPILYGNPLAQTAPNSIDAERDDPEVQLVRGLFSAFGPSAAVVDCATDRFLSASLRRQQPRRVRLRLAARARKALGK